MEKSCCGISRQAAGNRYIHLTMAGAYAAQLILTYPEIDLNGANRPTDPEALRRAAIAHFHAFLEGKPESPEAAPLGGKRGGYLPDFRRRQFISPASTESEFEKVWWICGHDARGLVKGHCR